MKQRILYLHRVGRSFSQIVNQLVSEGNHVRKPRISYFLKKFKDTGTITSKAGSGRKPTKTHTVLDFIDREITKDDKISLDDLKSKVEEQGLKASISNVHRWKQELGWTLKGTKCCQMVREANVDKRLAWAKENVHNINLVLDHLIFMDETTVQLENHRRTTSHGAKTQVQAACKAPSQSSCLGRN